MQRKLIAGLAVLLALFVLACAPEGGESDGKSKPQPNAQGPNGGNGNKQPGPDVNHPGPQADPGGPHQTPGENSAAFFLDWTSETKALPRIEYSTELGQPPIPAGASEMHVWKDGNTWHGAWERELPVRQGQVIGFSAFGTPSFTFVQCSISYEGQFHSVQGTPTTGDKRNCASSYTVF